MSAARLVGELEKLLAALVEEQGRVLAQTEAQHAAMKSFALDELEAAMRRQEASRLRISALESRRQGLIQQIARLGRLAPADLTIPRLAELYPQHGPALLRQRDQLKTLINRVAQRAQVAGRLAGAVLGHLNTAVRLLASAVEQSGIYTRHGTPRVSQRIGTMEATA